MSVVHTYSIPSNLRLVTSSGAQVSGMKKNMYYFRGGMDVVFIQANRGVHSVYTPPANTMDRAEITRKVLDQARDIEAEIETLKIGADQWFAYDTYTKKVLIKDSFMDWPPYYSVKRIMFIQEGSDIIYMLSNTSDYEALSMAAVLFAKKELMHQNRSGGWGNTGKALLTYIVSREYDIPVTLSGSDVGLWSGTHFEFPNDPGSPRFDITQMNTSAAVNKAVSLDPLRKKTEARAHKPETAASSRDDGYDDDDGDDPNWWQKLDEDVEGLMYLSDLVKTGADNISNGVWYVTIDMMHDVFSAIELDVDAGILKYKPSGSSVLSDEEIRANLGANRYTLVNLNKSNMITQQEGD